MLNGLSKTQAAASPWLVPGDSLTSMSMRLHCARAPSCSRCEYSWHDELDFVVSISLGVALAPMQQFCT